MPLNLNVNQSTGLKFQQPNFNPNEYKMQQNAQLMNALQQAPSLMLQYQALKQQREQQQFEHSANRVRDQLALLQMGRGQSVLGPNGEKIDYPGVSGWEIGLDDKGHPILNQVEGQTPTPGTSGVKIKPPAPLQNMIQPTDPTGAPIGQPTILPAGRLTVTKPASIQGNYSPLDKEMAKLDAKKLANQPKELKLLKNTEANFDRMIQEAEAIKSDPALGSALGYGQWLAKVPATDARRVKSRIDTLKSKTGFTVLQEMRASSPTGGALGAVSDRENQMLQENISSLDTGMKKEDFINSLNRVIDYAKQGKARLRSAYEDFYGQPQKEQVNQVNDDPLGLFK